jgi:hypothetical protein
VPTDIYESLTIYTVNDEEVYLTPLKVKYLKEVMILFEEMANTKNDLESIDVLVKCALATMKQYMPSIKTTEDLEDSFNLANIYKILEIGAGIKIDANNEKETVKDQAEKSSENSWANLDLAKLESELFLLGIWKDYEELETSLSMPEITITLNAKRDLEYQDKKFTAALKGIDLDNEMGEGSNEPDPWEAMKARVFSDNATGDPNDILSYQGIKAANSGFGIGMGMEYESNL